ncbi:phage late control D family protein [Serratia ureilytica]
MLSTDARLDRKALLGQPLTLEIPDSGFQRPALPEWARSPPSPSAAKRSAVTATRCITRTYSRSVAMTKDRNFRIFQEQTVPQIVKTLLAEHNAVGRSADRRLSPGATAQYNEQLQLHQPPDGVGGHLLLFQTRDGKHTLVLGDAPHHHQPYPGYEMIPTT